MIYDATSSWSGYQYQGKIAIYYAIKLLNDLTEDEVDKYSLEIEYMEDFSIKKSKSYISYHQVKAKTNATTMNSHLEAILKFYSNNNAKSYLHVIKKINNWSKENLNSLLKVSELSQLKDVLKNDLDELEIVDDTQKGFIKSKIDEEKYDETLTLLDSLEYNKEKKEKFDKLKNKILKTICLLDIDNFYERIGVYNYEDKNYCELNEIQNFIKKELLNFYKNNSLSEFEGKDELEKIYLNLLKKVDEHVLERHKDNTSKKEIELSDIKLIIENRNLLEAGEDYNISLLKNKFYNEIEKHCNECDEVECNKECNIKFLAENLKLLEKQNFKTIFKKINPKINLDIITSIELISCLENIDVLFDILEEISCKIFLEKNDMHFIKDKIYQPTLLKYKNHRPGRREAELQNLRRDILNNDSFLNLIQENQSLITNDIETKIDLNKSNLEEDGDEKLNKSIFCESLSLESKKTVKEKLNG